MKRLLLSLCLAICGLWLFAAPVSQEYARNIAEKFYRMQAPEKSGALVSDFMAFEKAGMTTFYVFCFDQGGFVIVAADDAIIPVLAYSTEETFNIWNIPANTLAFLEQYSNEISYIVNAGLPNTKTLKQWNEIDQEVMHAAKPSVPELLTTTWNQDCYYNGLCPAAAGGPCNRVYAGCVACAMAQIMNYWEYPTTGVGSYTYTDPTYGSQTANFGSTTYNWASMPNNVTSSNTAVATLMYHCAVAVDMQFGTSGSGAYSWDVPDALINYFAYQSTAEIKFKDDFTSANWIAMLKAELDAGRPVYYSGSNGSAGHAFVCDGYNVSDQFHFNWGWSGYSNGYYAIGSLNPTGYNFNTDNMAVVRIKPPSAAPVADFSASTTTPAIGGSVTFTDYSTNSPTSWSWAFQGGSPATSTSQNPGTITYAAAGVYQVSLTVSNANGTDTKVKTQYINVGGTPSAWIKQNTGFTTSSRGIDQICIVSPFIVWAKAYDGVTPTSYIREFTRTNNGGISWTPGTITFTNSTNYGCSNIFPMNDTVAYACMFPISGTGGVIVKTTNGGTTWTIQTTAPFTNSWANFVHFFNASEGVAMGDPTGSGQDFVIYTTTNGGTNWTQVAGGSIPNASGTEAGITNMYDAVGNTIWFGTTLGNIYKSTDKGLTWTKTATTLGTTAVAQPVFKDASTGIVTGTNNSTGAYIGMRKTTDGGSTWTTVTPTGYYVKNPHLDYVPGTTAMWVDVSAGPGIGSSYSNNDCSSFLNIDTGSVQYTTVTFYDINTGWAGGFNVSASDGGIYKWNSSILVGVDEKLGSEDDIVVYPNPGPGTFNISFGSHSGAITIEVYNLLGERIAVKDFGSLHGGSGGIDLSKHKAGNYLMSIRSAEGITTRLITLVK